MADRPYVSMPTNAQGRFGSRTVQQMADRSVEGLEGRSDSRLSQFQTACMNLTSHWCITRGRERCL